ncbi:MAG: phenylalanine--tRNA ligase beta subunit-related protein [Candidatus Shapirobacteria bacterium]|nr:phenylalanine--tRNA ligase beta subunit-related protein [Candidatus Shapirobacteria bacterium]
MKLIYSHLQKFLPNLNVKPQQLRDDLTMIGHFTNFFEEIDGEIVFDLDIKVNRGDCLGYYGLARDLSVFYNIPLKNLVKENPNNNKITLPIKVTTDNVKRVMAVKISDIKNSESPDWLKTFISLHGNSPINTLVDLTNYIMFMYGLPPHAFDTAKSTQNLIWQMNPGFKEFISLDASKFNIDKNILMINNPTSALSLSFWGGEACAINLTTTETIIEIAVYNPTTVRQNSRQIKAATEAGTRLEKELDPETIPIAFNHLVNLILENCSGQISSDIFDYYPKKIKSPQIKFDFKKPSLVSGIKIPTNFSTDVFTRLGCLIKDNLITPPSIRKDITLEADLIEEVIRFWGYQKIPTDQPIAFKKIKDITPKEIFLIDQLKDKLIKLGYDEILCWPLVNTPTNPKTVITTQNSINTEVIYLRQSLIPSLQQQLDQYSRFKLSATQFFEIGKVFSKEGDNFIEKNSLAIFCNDSQKLIQDLTKLNLKTNIIDQNFAEIIIDYLPKPKSYTPKVLNQPAYELTSQIIILDANITLDHQEDPINLIKKYSQIVGSKILWEMVITDIYHDPKNNKYRYTFRVSYFNTDDKTAKETHLKAFNLK